ncbi:MAG: transglutaminase family protein [Gammaproteobacteria bacterium]
MQRIEIQHLTRYRYAQPVRFMPHRLHLRPREGHDIRIESSALRISPDYSIRWQRDLYGNSVGIVSFDQEADGLEIASTVMVEQYEGPVATLEMADESLPMPWLYDDMEFMGLIPYKARIFEADTQALEQWLASLAPKLDESSGVRFLESLNKTIVESISYQERKSPGVQSPARTLNRGKGSCRDTATLFMEACRLRGFASRFVSGYLVSSATVTDLATTHAWAEVYLPGAGWRGFDTTSGQWVAGDHIAVAVHHHPEAIPPVSGSFIGPAKPRPVMEVEVQTLIR